MRLIFRKDENNEITVFLYSEEKESSFDYVRLIKALIKKEHLGESEVKGNFSEEEKASIKSMTDFMNKEIAGGTENSVVPSN